VFDLDNNGTIDPHEVLYTPSNPVISPHIFYMLDRLDKIIITNRSIP